MARSRRGRPKTAAVRSGPVRGSSETPCGVTTSALPAWGGALVVLVSGYAALTFEVLWARRLGLVFGGTVFAATAVLCAYTLGVALGGATLARLLDRPRLARRPLAVLAAVFLLLGLTGWAAHEWFVPAVARGNAAVFGGGPEHLTGRALVRFGWSLLALLPPSVVLGAVVPAVSRCVTPSGRRAGRYVGLVWGAATVGSVAGALITGFHTIWTYGVTATLVLAAALCVGLSAVLLAVAKLKREGRNHRRDAEGAETDDNRPDTRQLGLMVLLSGATMLAAEALSIRALVFFLSGTTYTFTVVVSTYLAGLGLGSLVSAGWADRMGRPWLWLGRLMALTGLAVGASVLLIGQFAAWGVGASAGGRSWSATLGLVALVSAAAVFAPALFSGACMPFFMRLAAVGGHVGRHVGRVTALYNLGAAVGAAAAVLLAVPALGVQRTLALAAGLSLFLGAGAFVRALRETRGEKGDIPHFPPQAARRVLRRNEACPRFPRAPAVAGGAACAAGLGLVVVLLVRDLSLFWPGIVAETPGGRQVFYDEGPDAVVSVSARPAVRTHALLMNRHIQGDDSELGTLVQWRQGLIPLLLHPAPQRVLVIGLGTGATAFAASALTEGQVDVVEISPGVVQAARHFPPSLNGALYDDPKVRVIVEDGRAFLANTPDRYDAIVIDIIYPNLAGAGNVFSRDFYEVCLSRLNEGGVLCHWIPTWQIQPTDLGAVAAAFAQANAKHRGRGTSVWCAVYSVRQPVVGFVSGGLDLGLAALHGRAAAPRARGMLDLVGLATPLDLFTHLVTEDVAAFRPPPGVPANSDERPWVEFAVPQHGNAGAGAATLAVLRERLLDPFRAPHLEDLGDVEWRTALANRMRAVGLVIAGQFAGETGDARAEEAAYVQARQLGWNDPIVSVFERQARCLRLMLEADQAASESRTAEAIARAREATQSDPTNAAAFDLLARCLGLSTEADLRPAEAALRAVEIDPTVVDYRLTLAASHFRQKDFRSALKELRALLDGAPGNLQAQRLRADILKDLKLSDNEPRDATMIRRLEQGW
jgi:spermidine synthase